MPEDLTLRDQRNPRDIMTASATNLNSLVELDIGTIDKNNATQMDLFLKITCFIFPVPFHEKQLIVISFVLTHQNSSEW